MPGVPPTAGNEPLYRCLKRFLELKINTKIELSIVKSTRYPEKSQFLPAVAGSLSAFLAGSLF